MKEKNTIKEKDTNAKQKRQAHLGKFMRTIDMFGY